MTQHTFDNAGEAILASLLALAFAALVIANMIRRSAAWIIIFPFAWGFTQWAVDSWRETFKKKDINVQPHNAGK